MTRVKAAVVSGYFNTFRDSILSLSHCIDNYIPNVLQYAEMYDIAGLIAPRALFIESGTEDTIFPIEATRFAVNEAKAIFNCFNADDKLGFSRHLRQGHSFYGVGAFEFSETGSINKEERVAIELFSIGTELVLGQIQDTNAHWIAQQILQAGGELRSELRCYATTREEMSEALGSAVKPGNVSYPHNRRSWTHS